MHKKLQPKIELISKNVRNFWQHPDTGIIEILSDKAFITINKDRIISDIVNK